MRILGLASVSFRDHIPQTILEAVRDNGLDAIEWGSDVHVPPHKVAEIAALQQAYGVTCCSYGTYFRLGVTPLEELPQYIAAAQVLGTNILRVWCGDKNSEEYTASQAQDLFAVCKEAAEMARKRGVVLCMECHNGTFTNRKEAALALMRAVDSAWFGMYWQPNQFRTHAENMAYATWLAPYVRRVHVFHWQGDAKFPLCEAVEKWRAYASCFGEDIPFLLEFMPDGRLESLGREVRALREITT